MSITNSSHHWRILNQDVPQTVTEVSRQLVIARGIADEEQFFAPPNPMELEPDMVGIDREQLATAVELIRQAIDQQQKIVVFGDYDADGISASAVLWLTLHQLGGQVLPFIPIRDKHGYGLSDRALDDLLAEGKPDLVITVDNGIVAHGPVERLEQLGITTIVTDHHVPEQDEEGQALLPAAAAIVHTTQLCGASVAWILAKELDHSYAATLLDLTAIATIADQVPLTRANRSFAYWGLAALRTTDRVGIRALLSVANIDQASLDANSINFGLAPRINAMGRLAHGLDALRLLCTASPAQAEQLSHTLQSTNLQRQDLTLELLDLAKAEQASWADEQIIIVHSTQYHDGVIGLIAGRLTEEYHKPAIAISVTGGVAKASARSVSGVDIVDLIRQVRSDLLEVGGHPMAAGFSLETNKIETVVGRLQQLARQQINDELLLPETVVDMILPWSLVSVELVDLLQRFAPFGAGNPQPVFGLLGGRISDARAIGKSAQHLKLTVSDPQYPDHQYTCLGWGMGQLLESLTLGESIDIAGSIEVNEWQGKRRVQVVVKDAVD